MLANLYATAKIKLQVRESDNKALRDTLEEFREQEPVKIKKAATEAKKQGRKQGVIFGAVGLTVLEVVFLVLLKF